MQTNADKLTGSRVVTQEGRQLGVVTGLDIEMEDWRVSALAVRLDRQAAADLGLARRLFRGQTVHIPVEHIAGATDTVVLKLTLSDIVGENAGEPVLATEVAALHAGGHP